MKALAIVGLLAATAHADDHCAAGLAAARKGDLARAALYLEGCTGDDATRAAADVSKKLRDSQLSEIAIVTTPTGLPVTTTAMPGEPITSPATVWAKAGTYAVTVTDHDRVFTQTIVLQPHSRATAVIDVPAPKPQVITDHTVTFDDHTDVEQHAGPPPDIKHPSLLPCKFANACTEAGDPIADPLADKTYSPHDGATAPLRIGLRVGGGIPRVGTLAMSLGTTTAYRLSPHLTALARLDWTRRESTMQGLDALALSAGLATPLVTTAPAVLAAGLAARGEVRFQDTFDARPVDTAGLAADATLDVILRDLPFVVGVRLSQGVTPLVADTRETAVLLELGLELR